ncbi:hypothetical protein ACLKA7_010040 [Drosophila subpalustris]
MGIKLEFFPSAATGRQLQFTTVKDTQRANWFLAWSSSRRCNFDSHQLNSAALCPKQQQTRPANHTEVRQKLQGRKPKFKVSNKHKFNTRKAKHKCSTLMIMRTTTKIENLTAKKEKTAAAEGATMKAAATATDSYLRQQLNGETVAPS